MGYNTSFMNNATNILDLSIGLGGAMGNEYLIGNLLLFSFAVIFLILGTREDFMYVLIIDLFITSILSILMFMIGMVSAISIIVPFVLFAILLIIKLILVK